MSSSVAAKEVRRFARFCSSLTLDNGRPMRLQAFQRAMLEDYFAGATESVIIIPKKNGKTTLLGALALFELVSGRDREIAIAAASRDQASILFEQAAGLVRRTPGLAEGVKGMRGYRVIASRTDHGRIRVLASDVDTVDGWLGDRAFVDELHRHRSSALYGVLRDGLGPRAGKMVAISTAGESEASVLGEMRSEARRVPRVDRDGAHLRARSANGAYALHEWALDRDDDVDDMKVVKTANPASWQTPARLQQRHDSPSMLTHQWLRFACGIWVGQDAWWITGEDWAALEGGRLEAGDRVTVGFDGSRVSDSTALVLCRVEDGLLELAGLWEAPPKGKGWEVPGGEVDAALAGVMERYKVVRGYFDPPLWQAGVDGGGRGDGGFVGLGDYTSKPRGMAGGGGVAA